MWHKVWKFIDENVLTKKMLGIGVAASAAIPVLTPFAIPLVGIGSMVFGSDFQHGATIGTPLGQKGRDFVAKVRAAVPKDK